jgi:hypothetical protein
MWTRATFRSRIRAALLNTLSATGDFHSFDLTLRLVPDPSRLHPVDAERSGE